MPKKVTDWYKVATAGPSIDGRTIHEKWLTDMAETYAHSEYTALIWPEHYRWFNCGLVDSVKAEKDEQGRMSLYVRLEPNDNLLAYNEQGQKLFTSIEVTENYAKSGKTYLTGLAVTDSPASLGTERLAFSKGTGTDSTLFSQPLEIGAITLPEPSRLEKLLQSLPGFNKSPTHDEESKAMDKAQFDALLAAIKAQEEKFTALSAVLTGLEEKFAKLQTPATATPGDGNNGKPADEQAQVQFTAEDAKKLTDTLAAMQKTVDDLQKEFSALRKEPAPGTTVPPATGAKPAVC